MSADHANTPSELAAVVGEALSIGLVPDSQSDRDKLNAGHEALDALAAQAEAFHRHVETMIEPKLLARAEAAEAEVARLKKIETKYAMVVGAMRRENIAQARIWCGLLSEDGAA